MPRSFKMLLRQVLELRERRLDHEETLAEVQKATDEHKRNLDRQVRTPRRVAAPTHEYELARLHDFPPHPRLQYGPEL